jgi:hypothetical protein
LERFLARQPIFNHQRIVYGYEVLFRSGPENYFDYSHPDAAAASSADSLLRYLNSPAFPFVANVASIPQGLSLLGERGTRK